MNNERPPLYLRLVGQDVDVALGALAAAGIGADAVDGQPGSVRLHSGADVDAALTIVRATVQDPAASHVARFADPGMGVLLDLCAAPGGKAVVLAAGDGTGRASRVRVVAADVSWPRMQRVIENVRRLELPVGMVVADGRTPPFLPAGAVLVDAPCTGTGTLRRHADARWRIGPSDLAALERLQAELLDGAATATAPGGLLVYATCSLEDEENDGQVDAFLARNAGFEADRARIEGDDAAAAIGADGRLRLLPHVHGFDGAYAVRLRRRH
jgi:16S rRNA (cytosine967-C5)-methyltransferase